MIAAKFDPKVRAPTASTANPVRVLQLTSSIGFYGAERMIMTLIMALDRRSFDIRVASLEKKRISSTAIVSAARSADIWAVTIPCRGRLDWGAVRTLKSLIEDQGIQILHCHEPKSRLYGAIVSKMTGVPIVTTQHNWTRQDIRTMIVEFIDAVCLHLCDKAIAVSSPVAESMRRVLISSSRIEVIPNGIDLEGFSDTKPDAGLRASLGIPTRLPVIGSVGRLDIVKGHELLIEAARKTTDAGHDAAYLIVGEGVEKANLEARARSLGLAGRVFFAGYQSDVKPFLALMDVFVLPSRREGTPMALLEAMAMSKPVVSTPVGGVPDILSDGVDGIILRQRDAGQLSDALIRLLGDPRLADRLGQQGRRRVDREFSACQMAERYEAVYRACLASRGQPATSVS